MDSQNVIAQLHQDITPPRTRATRRPRRGELAKAVEADRRGGKTREQ
jgi:hypothetical protein